MVFDTAVTKKMGCSIYLAKCSTIEYGEWKSKPLEGFNQGVLKMKIGGLAGRIRRLDNYRLAADRSPITLCVRASIVVLFNG